MIRLSCADNGFRLVQPWESAVALIALLEIEAVDVCCMGNRSHIRPEHLLDGVEAAADRIRSSLTAHGLAVSDLFCIPWTDFERFAPNHPDAEERARSHELFERVLDLAVAIAAPGLTMLPGIHWPQEPFELSFERAAEELARRAAAARSRGIAFSIEPHLGSIAQRPDDAARLCREAHGLELTLDYSHFVYQGIAESEIEPLIVHSRHLHARGARAARMQCSLASSTIDFERMVAALLEHGYEGDIGLEYLWIDWEHLNECDVVSETLLLRDRLRARLEGRAWSYPESMI